eukprot:419448_1
MFNNIITNIIIFINILSLRINASLIPFNSCLILIISDSFSFSILISSSNNSFKSNPDASNPKNVAVTIASPSILNNSKCVIFSFCFHIFILNSIQFIYPFINTIPSIVLLLLLIFKLISTLNE